MSNLFREFQKLIPSAPLLVGTVTAIDGQIRIVTLPDGATIRARGEGAVNAKVFVRDGKIEGPAPSLAVVQITI